MKKWSQYSIQEKIMLLIIVILIVAVLLSYSRIFEEAQKSFSLFWS